jgi:hypothetical protein
LGFSSASATAFLRDWDNTFIARMKADRMKQMLFDTTSGHKGRSDLTGSFCTKRFERN